MQTIIAQNRLANATKMVKDGSLQPKSTFLSDPADMQRMEEAARCALPAVLLPGTNSGRPQPAAVQ